VRSVSSIVYSKPSTSLAMFESKSWVFPLGYSTFGFVAGGNSVPLPKSTVPVTVDPSAAVIVNFTWSEPDVNCKSSMYPFHVPTRSFEPSELDPDVHPLAISSAAAPRR
jgi:hypothetical protein